MTIQAIGSASSERLLSPGLVRERRRSRVTAAKPARPRSSRAEQQITLPALPVPITCYALRSRPLCQGDCFIGSLRTFMCRIFPTGRVILLSECLDLGIQDALTI
jgi:hypothetical protein